MTSDPRYNHLREQSWRRKLTIAEEAELRVWLSNHPDAQPDSEAEAALTEMLGNLPEAPVPSNFTARVLQAIEREDAREARQPRANQGVWATLRRWLPKAAFASVLMGTALVSYHHHQLRAAAKSVVAVSKVSPLPGPEILQDFDAIRVMNRTPPADVQLLSLLE